LHVNVAIVTSQDPEKACCSPNKLFVAVLEKCFLLKRTCPFWSGLCNLADL